MTTLSDTDFNTLKLQPMLLENLSSLGYESMTPIQAQSLPPILAGKDVIAQGKTGSGKTAAFSLGLLEVLDSKRFDVQSLILCPTRELADQVAKQVRLLARSIPNIKVLTLCGGTPFGPQINSLEHGVHIVVGTPGRVEEHLKKGTLTLDTLSVFVLDEADRMLDMGFQPALDAIVEYIPEKRQTLLFSATFPSQIKSIAKRIMDEPVMVQLAAGHDSETIRQYLYKVADNADRVEAIRLLLLCHKPESTVVFCNTKREAQAVADELYQYGFNVAALHGDLDQKARDQTLARFVNKSITVLVATDVAARGLDIDALDAVINYHIASEVEVHVHRIGRTGRAGNKGLACSLCSDKEHHKITRLEDYLGYRLEEKPLPPSKLLMNEAYAALMTTLQIDGGKKQKVRAGDILGALTGDNGIQGGDVGKIQIFDHKAYVAVSVESAPKALKKLETGKLKGRSFRVRWLR